ncbi:MAG: tetratricopeptide repeat protein [Stellaceae bacterium]
MPRPLPSLLLVLSAAAVLGIAGCSTGGANRESASLSQLPDPNHSMLKVANASLRAGNCVTALRLYRVTLKKGADRHEAASAHLGTAECHLAMGDITAAEQDYRVAAKLEPAAKAPLIGLGRVYLVRHQPQRAVRYLDAAIKKGANDADVWNDKGVALDQMQHHKAAQVAYRQGLAAHPSDLALHNNLALSLAMTGDFLEAEAMLRQLASMPDATDRVRENLALVLGLEGKDAEARAVSASDLNGAALDNNTRFYRYARALLTGAPLPSATARNADTGAARHAAKTAQAAPPMPPPVLVMDKPKPDNDIALARKSTIVETAALPEPALRKSDAGMGALSSPNPFTPAPLTPTGTVAAATPVASSNVQ